MENYMVYTPEAHIAITEVYAENGVVYLKFKNHRVQRKELKFLYQHFSSILYSCYTSKNSSLYIS